MFITPYVPLCYYATLCYSMLYCITKSYALLCHPMLLYAILRNACYVVPGYIVCYTISSVSRGQPFFWHAVPLLSRCLSEPSFSRTSQAKRSIPDNSETSFSLMSRSNLCPEFHRPVRSIAYA